MEGRRVTRKFVVSLVGKISNVYYYFCLFILSAVHFDILYKIMH